MCKVLGIIFLQTEWNGPIVRFLSNSYCVIVFPAWHESKKNEHSPRFEVCLASKSRIPELETQPEIWGNMYLLHYKSVKAVQVNILYYTVNRLRLSSCHSVLQDRPKSKLAPKKFKIWKLPPRARHGTPDLATDCSLPTNSEAPVESLDCGPHSD